MKLEDYFEIYGTYEIVEGVYNVKGSVYLRSTKEVEKLPVKFGKVSGHFDCSVNKLKTLEGCPISIGGSFSCDGNELTSLKGCPISIGGDFWCDDNKLKSLKGCPSSVDGGFYCNINKLKSLKGCPSSIGGSFSCDEHLHNTKEYRQYLIMRKLRQ